MSENEYQRLSRTLSRSEFTKLFRHPFIVFGDLDDDWNFEFKTRSVGPPSWSKALSSDEGTRRTPVIALTAYPIGYSRHAALEAGCDAYLTKPCGPRQLLAEIRRLLDARG